MSAIYDKASLSATIKSALDSGAIQGSDPNDPTKNQTPEQTRQSVSDAIADAVDTYVKQVINTARVSITAETGQIIVAGSATTQQNEAPIALTEGTIA